VRLNSKWNFAKTKATDALAALGGSTAENALAHAETSWPSKLNPYAGAALAGAQEEVTHVVQDRVGMHGLKLGKRPGGGAAPASAGGASVVHGGFKWTKNADGTYTKEAVGG
jgi:hypothetical protein